jgi:16S rRNA (guanine1207-N2)-methyltransferase
VSVTAIDANPRAVECTRRGAELNGLRNITTLLNADAECDVPGSYDLVLANPPYYSHFRIGELFVRGANRALRPGGVLQLVTKQPDPYLALVRSGFRDPTVTTVRQYQIVRAVALGS